MCYTAITIHKVCMHSTSSPLHLCDKHVTNGVRCPLGRDQRDRPTEEWSMCVCCVAKIAAAAERVRASRR